MPAGAFFRSVLLACCSPVEACALVVCVFFNIFYAAYVIGCVTLLVVKGDERVGKVGGAGGGENKLGLGGFGMVGGQGGF